jgi:hypothetical protein
MNMAIICVSLCTYNLLSQQTVFRRLLIRYLENSNAHNGFDSKSTAVCENDNSVPHEENGEEQPVHTERIEDCLYDVQTETTIMIARLKANSSVYLRCCTRHSELY